MSVGVSIGVAAKACGVKVPTVRFYEQIGLMPPMVRTDGNRRLYGPADVKRLTFIRHARELGFEIDAIRELLQLQDQPDQPCAVADDIARGRLAEVRQRIASLRALEAELERMVGKCSHGRVAECRVIEVLADHCECRFHAHEADGAEADGAEGG
jgi:DNA-binding transcriptional MerR regulator